tara:strand:- start:20 stop:475 length:456 start_codon:yes stop_codon:yes gene_type:complete
MHTLFRSSSFSDSLTFDARRYARIVALQVLYETDLVWHDMEGVLERSTKENSLATKEVDFTKIIVTGVFENREKIDSIITQYASNWPIEQMAIVDKNILRIALFEMLMRRNTPPKVAINESIELAKSFGSDSSPRFVNGVLGSVMLEMHAI